MHPLMNARISTALVTGLLVATGSGLARAEIDAPRPSLVMAKSSLGDLSPFRTIAVDVLKMVKAGDLPAAKTRIKDLETAWDAAEGTTRPRDEARWTTLDKAIDVALGDLRIPKQDAATCAKDLQTVVDMFDTATRTG